MGDKPLQSSAPTEFPQQDAPVAAGYPPPLSPQAWRHPEQPAGPQHAFAFQFDMAHQQRTGSFDLSSMASALPQVPQPPFPVQPYSQSQPRYNVPTMQSPGVAPISVSSFGAPNSMGPYAGQQYYVPQHVHMAQFYPAPLTSQPPAAMPPRAAMGYYPASVLPNQSPHLGTHYYYPAASPIPGQPPHVQGQIGPGQFVPPNLHQHPAPRSRQSQPNSQDANPVVVPAGHHGDGSAESRQNVVRGPPRKPRQSGHAIWIGNLPPQTDLMTLVQHVCKEADGLESLFLISKSNCAFANFKDEQSCSAAQKKLHDSKFMTVRLVSRLRKSTVEGPAGLTAPTGPAASSPQAGSTQEPSIAGSDETGENGVTASTPAPSAPETKSASTPTDTGPFRKDRFFILKSLTVEDLELSVRTSLWATQSHNEETLNSAFKTSDNVYLVFSANKSGEYFGYARMASPINEDPAAAIEFAPTAQLASDVDLPKAIPTEATEYAPKGRIIDDSARGTIFWEADRNDKGTDGGQEDEGSGGSVGGDTSSVRSGQDSGGAGGGAGETSRAWGKPFRLEWLSTARLPFYRTRGLRNPWNSNREVKIARDGTELEPSVGRRLIGLFNRAAQSPALGMVVPGLGAQQGFPAGIRVPIPMAVTPGFPPPPAHS